MAPGRLLPFALAAALLILASVLHDAWGRTGTNQPPLISGSPPLQVEAGHAYGFAPQASDPDGDRLAFSIANKPAWALFNRKTGQLSGTPGAADAGTTRGITIRVSDRLASTALPPFDLTVTLTTANRAPIISGTPATAVRVGTSYLFLPTASDPDGDLLTFSIVNRPPWALFNSANGALTGTPGAADVGTVNAITISTSDGFTRSSLPPFSIAVVAANQATLRWVAPSMREDGSPLALSEIAGFRLWHGLDPSTTTLAAELRDPTASQYTLTGLSSGLHYFAVTVYDTSGLESGRSTVLTRVIP